MDQLVASKTRVLVNAQSVATASATAYPSYVHGSKYPADMRGARIAGARWTMADLDTFTAADCTLQTTDEPKSGPWHTLKVFTQKSADGNEKIDFLDTDPKPLRFVRALIDMTGVPGSATHTVELFYDQIGPRGEYADGVPDAP